MMYSRRHSGSNSDCQSAAQTVCTEGHSAMVDAKDLLSSVKQNGLIDGGFDARSRPAFSCCTTRVCGAIQLGGGDPFANRGEQAAVARYITTIIAGRCLRSARRA
jgi:hypothetical protein